MRLMNRARVAGDRFTSTSTSRPARSCAVWHGLSTHADVPVAHGPSAACRPLHELNSICAVSTRLKPGAIDLVPPTAAESLQAPVRAQPRMELNTPLPRAFQGNVQTPGRQQAAALQGAA